jgi:hypothetical protein
MCILARIKIQSQPKKKGGTFEEILNRQWKTGNCNQMTAEVTAVKSNAAYSRTNPTTIVVVVVVIINIIIITTIIIIIIIIITL